MTENNVRFNAALDVVLAFEGGRADDVRDPGGLTLRGISLAFLQGLGVDINKDGVVDRADVEALTDAQVRGLYRAEFWQACKCDDLPAGLDLAVFDCAVNQGPPTAAKLLQKAAGVKADGLIGPVTLRAAARDPAVVLLDFCARRGLRYAAAFRFPVFGRGWLRRLLAVYFEASIVCGERWKRPF